MTTYSIKDAAYGAKGDGQQVTDTLTMASGGTRLTTGSNHWDFATPANEIGKKIFIGGAGNQGSTGGEAGGLTDILSSTITGVPAPNQVDIANAAVRALSSVSRPVAWGNDDAPAFQAFVAAHQAETGVVLTIPASSGFYPLWGLGGSGLTKGVKQIHMLGDVSQPIIRSDAAGIRIGSIGIGTEVDFQGPNYLGDGTNGVLSFAYLEDTTTGNSVQCITHAEASKFGVNDWVCLIACETQSSGYPGSPAFFEYHQVLSSNSTTGIVTFTTPIESPNVYKKHYPCPGGTDMKDGSASLFRLGGTSLNDWDTETTIENVHFIGLVHQLNIKGRSNTFINCIIDLTPDISVNVLCTFTNCTWLSSSEPDKFNDTVNISGGSIHFLHCQSSSSARYLNLDNLHIDIMNGTTEDTTITNSTIDNFTPGSTGFHRNLTVTDTHIELWGAPQVNVSTTAALIDLITGLTAGVITTDGFDGGSWFPLYAPGNHCMFGSTGSYPVLYGPGFMITDIAGPNLTNNGDPITITTTYPNSGIPNAPVNPAAIVLNALPKVTFTRVTSTKDSYKAADLNNSPANVVFRSYLKRFYNKGGVRAPSAPSAVTGFESQYDNLFDVVGKIVSIVVNVLTEHTGSTNPLYFAPFSPGDNEPFAKSDGSTVTWAPHFDLRVPGKRTITPAGVTGAQPNDTNLTMPFPYLWIYNASNPFISANVSTESGGLDFYWEVITDQGFIAAAPTSASLTSRPRIRMR